jgi:hypothetical protein
MQAFRAILSSMSYKILEATTGKETPAAAALPKILGKVERLIAGVRPE